MTEKEKALGYLQMRKDEGKLGGNALQDLTALQVKMSVRAQPVVI